MGDRWTFGRRSWRPLKTRLRRRLWSNRKWIILFFLLFLQLVGFLGYSWYGASIPYGRQGPIMDHEGEQIIFFGEAVPKEPERLGGLTTTVNVYTPEELRAEYDGMDFIYSFVNGTEPNHAFRRMLCRGCMDGIHSAEEDFYARGEPFKASPCRKPGVLPKSKTVRGVLEEVSEVAARKLSARDRERDELHYSIRSVEQHMRWHRGRLVIVSPGHNPHWVDNAKNFLSSALKSNRGEHMRGRHARITTVHQDALMPYGLRLTMDSHVIEMQLFRVRNITPIHVYLNDDYFINRDVGVTDLLNEHGGTYVRTERGLLRGAVRSDNGSAWINGVYNTNLFNMMELDVRKEDYLPVNLLRRWKEAGYNFTHQLPVASGDDFVHVARAYAPDRLPTRLRPRSPRFFATHAPFVYCTRMFEYFNVRYELEMAANMFRNRRRSARDIFTPFAYNAFIMARPWQTSPRFLPYLAALRAGRTTTENTTATPPPLNVVLDNKDACAPATLLRRPASGAMYTKFRDKLEENEEIIKKLKEVNPLFFNINDGFSEQKAGAQLQEFLASLFSKPVFVERGNDSPNQESHGAMFKAIMKLPIVIFASYTEAFCPLVRSLRLGMPEFTGDVILVEDISMNANNVGGNLANVRLQKNHRVINAMPVVMCTFSSNVKKITIPAGMRIEEEVQEALNTVHASVDSPVPLPTDYIAGDNIHVSAFAIDARTLHSLDSIADLTRALEVPGQSLALEDFEPVPLRETKGSVLVLSRGDAAKRAVHWINGASETDLLLTFPLPYSIYEDIDVPVRWSFED